MNYEEKIAQLEARIAALEAQVAENHDSVLENRARIEANLDKINTNLATIEANKANIEKNAHHIKENRKNIEDNKKNIEDNKRGILHMVAEYVAKGAEGTIASYTEAAAPLHPEALEASEHHEGPSAMERMTNSAAASSQSTIESWLNIGRASETAIEKEKEVEEEEIKHH